MTADIQLIATDLDGTFLRDDKTFDEVLFKSVLQKLKIKNIPFVITTGVHQERINVLLANFLDSGTVQAVERACERESSSSISVWKGSFCRSCGKMKLYP